MIRYDPHAEFQLARRGLEKMWIEAVCAHEDKLSLLACFPERGKMLRVVVRRDDPEYVMTAYFDMEKPCA